MTTLSFTILACLLLGTCVQALENGLARTPPMGWMSWQRFRCLTDCNLYPDECISDKLVREMADLMASDGYLEAGYEYLVIDDCWLEYERDENGKLQPDRVRFPNGMKALADYIHGRGLKFGMYQDIGTHTCAGYPGLKDHLEIDANTFAEWEIDYIKVDGCNAVVADYERDYADFGRYLNQTGRPIVYACSWPFFMELEGIHPNYPYAAEMCNLWRNWIDIQDSYSSWTSITDWYINNPASSSVAGPGHWNDPDMLLVGNYGLSYEQSKSQMAIWAIMAAPLLMSVDFRTVHSDYRNLLLHQEVLAINQDELGIQGRIVSQDSSIHVWTRQISPVINGAHSYAIAFQSRRDDGNPFVVQNSLQAYGLTNANGYQVRDVFEPSDDDTFLQLDETFIVRVRPSGVVLLRLTPVL